MSAGAFEASDDDAAMVSLSYLLKTTGYGRSAAYAAMAEGLLPRPVKVGRCSRWPLSEVLSVHDAIMRGDDKASRRALVRLLRAQRGGALLSVIHQ